MATEKLERAKRAYVSTLDNAQRELFVQFMNEYTETLFESFESLTDIYDEFFAKLEAKVDANKSESDAANLKVVETTAQVASAIKRLEQKVDANHYRAISMMK